MLRGIFVSLWPVCTGEDLRGAKKPQKLLARLKAFADATLAGGGGGAPLLALVGAFSALS